MCEIFDCELFIAWSIYFSKQKNILLFLGLFVLIFYSGGEGVFSLFKQSVGFLFYLFIDFFSPFCFERSFNKINYENEWGSRGAFCIIYLNLFSLLSCNWHYLNGAEIDKIRSAVSLSRSPNRAYHIYVSRIIESPWMMVLYSIWDIHFLLSYLSYNNCIVQLDISRPNECVLNFDMCIFYKILDEDI